MITESLDQSTLKCNVCDQPAIGVCNVLGPTSAAMCADCLKTERVPYWNLVGYFFMVADPITRESINPAFLNTVDQTLAFYKKSWDDFAMDCHQAVQEYEEHVNNQESRDEEAQEGSEEGWD